MDQFFSGKGNMKMSVGLSFPYKVITRQELVILNKAVTY